MNRTRFVPFKVNFNLVKSIEKWLEWILYLAVVLGICILGISKYFEKNEDIFTDDLNYIVGILSLFYFLGDMIKKFLLQLAEQKRRADFIDNSLNTNLAEMSSAGYYSNDNFDPGVYKMGVNCFENAFFSMTISSRMIGPLVFKSLLIILLFSLLGMITNKMTIASFMQFALPYTVLQQTIVLTIYHFQITSIFNYFKMLFTSAQEEKRDLLIIHNVINYESTIAWAGVILNDQLFAELNDELSAKWEQMKINHHIK